jgi:hypothetical protein
MEGHKNGAARVRAIDNPRPLASFGSLERFVRVDADGADAAFPPMLLRIEHQPDDVGWVDPATLRVFAVDLETGECSLVANSAVNTEHRYAYAWIERPGTYGVIGLPAHPAILSAIRLFDHLAGGSASGAFGHLPNLVGPICRYILCGDPSGPYARDRGLASLPPPGRTGGDVCQRCLGLHAPPVRLPEAQLVRPRPPEVGFGDLVLPKPPGNGDLAFPSRGSPTPNTEIHRCTIGANPVQLTTTPAAEYGPAWSPDGKKIAFSSNRAGLFRIWVMTDSGASPTSLTGVPDSDDGWPAWSPGGERVAFVRSRAGDDDIWVVDYPTGLNPTRLTAHPGRDTHPSWRPLAAQLAFASDRAGRFGIWRMKDDGTDLKQPTGGPDSDDDWPAWSPAGTDIAFSRAHPSGSPSSYPTAGIWLMGPEASNPRPLTAGPAFDYAPAWSPDGERIAFIREHAAQERDEVWVMDRDGGNQSPVPHTAQVGNFLWGTRSVSWQVLATSP